VPAGEKQDVHNKKMYRALGITLAKKYPHMLWDTRSKKTKSAQLWVLFIFYINKI